MWLSPIATRKVLRFKVMEEPREMGGNGSRTKKAGCATKKVMATLREGRRCQ